jgi:DNA-binding NarL/FixJ family response regulator
MPPLNAETQIATRSDDIVARALAGSVDLVICDILAEPLNGNAVVNALAQHCPRIPVILLGELDEMTGAPPLLLQGAAGVFTKNVMPADLVAGVEAVLAGHQALGANLFQMVLASGVVPSSTMAAAAKRLSPAERKILVLVGRAMSVPEIAAARQITHKTVRNHLASIYRKLDLESRAQATLFAARLEQLADIDGSAPVTLEGRPSLPRTQAPADRKGRRSKGRTGRGQTRAGFTGPKDRQLAVLESPGTTGDRPRVLAHLPAG